MKKGFLKNFTKFTGKHLCRSLIFNKVAGLSPAILSKTKFRHCFPVNLMKFYPFFTEHFGKSDVEGSDVAVTIGRFLV